MVGTISINIISNNKHNNYPLVLYYNGEQKDMLALITSNIKEQLKEYCTLEDYANTKLYYISFFTADDNIDTKEDVSRGEVELRELMSLLENEDLIVYIIKTVLQRMGNTTDDISVSTYINEGISMKTISNYFRKTLGEYGFNKEECVTIQRKLNDIH